MTATDLETHLVCAIALARGHKRLVADSELRCCGMKRGSKAWEYPADHSHDKVTKVSVPTVQCPQCIPGETTRWNYLWETMSTNFPPTKCCGC